MKDEVMKKSKFKNLCHNMHVQIKQVHPFLNALRVIINAIFAYIVLLLSVVYICPILLSTLAGAMGLSYESEILDILGLFAFPGLLACGFLFVGVLIVLKAFWIWSKRFFNRWIKEESDSIIKSDNVVKMKK